jgi:hypothetical protein
MIVIANQEVCGIRQKTGNWFRYKRYQFVSRT